MSRVAARRFLFILLLTPVLGAAVALMAQAPNQQAARDKIIPFVRQRFVIPDSVKVTITDLRDSIYPDYFETTVTVDDGKDKRSQPLFVTRNLRYMVEGSIFNFAGDSREEVLRLTSLRDQASQGPANAPVTLVEYSDLECPVCARLHQELEDEIVPKYGDKLRIVFKEFPLVNVHQWAMMGAIAAQCSYQIDPSRYAAFRTAVFKGQESVTAEHARDMLLHFGAEAGLDNMKLAACIDAKTPLARIDANMNEGNALGVNQTPTSYVNGRAVLGAAPATDYYKLIDEALHDAK